jgi:predicted glycogen debranching enzyme
MNLPVLTYPKEAFLRFSSLIEKEWLITNGSGSYASSSVMGINTRKYHGLLVAALDPPGNRTVCLSKLDEDVLVGNDIYRLGSNEFHDIIYPNGYKLIRKFKLDLFPTYTYDLGNLQVSKTVFLPTNKNAVALLYKIANKHGSAATIRIYPLLTCRYYHTVVNQAQVPLNFTLKTAGSEFQVTFQSPQATILCHITNGEFRKGINWVNHLHYREELRRGESDVDDCFQPGVFDLIVPAGEEKEFAVTCAVSHESKETENVLRYVGNTIQEVKVLLDLELNRKSDLLSAFHRNHSNVPMSDWLNWILLAASSFIVQNVAGRKVVIAGYHWFESWGRDTFISLPGLLLVTGRYNDAKDILRAFMAFSKSGLIPNFISDKSGVPVYNTVDATLWYVNALLQYVKYTDDFSFVKDELWEKLKDIVEEHQKGTLFGIRVDSDGLLMHGPRLTWMDASVGDNVITQRAGKAVEIQALWYNALNAMKFFASKFREPALVKKYNEMANQTKKSFGEKFWNPKTNCLFDVVENENSDPSIRPNQVFAAFFDYSILDNERTQSVVEVVNRELVTPYGLKTLSASDPKFIGKYSGDRRSRDMAYHNGTIWPWLLGPYVTVYLKVNDYSGKAREQALQNLILPLFSTGIHQGGLGTINEIYDSNLPNEPRGCISQAWSVAEPLRAYIEDILQIKPRFG